MTAGDLYKPHIYLTWGGTFWGSETWQMGVRMTNPGIPLTATADEFCADHIADAASDISTWWDSGNCGQSHWAQLDWVKMNAIGADGKYVNTSTTHQVRVSPAKIPSSYPNLNAQMVPPQVALVLSLRTGNRGPREAWGHIYMPCAYIKTVTDQPYFLTADTENIAANFADFIRDLNDWPGIDSGSPEVCIASKYSAYTDRRTGTPKVFEAENTVVTDVWVGNLFDTHRSRRKQLRETYSKVAL